jgi:hypothetical protein
VIFFFLLLRQYADLFEFVKVRMPMPVDAAGASAKQGGLSARAQAIAHGTAVVHGISQQFAEFPGCPIASIRIPGLPRWRIPGKMIRYCPDIYGLLLVRI